MPRQCLYHADAFVPILQGISRNLPGRYSEGMTEPFIEETIGVLERTPAALDALLRGLPNSWIRVTDGPDTWSPYDVLGHLIHGERTDWMPRLGIILEHGPDRPFDPFDRDAQFNEPEPGSVNGRLDEFQTLRAGNLERLRALRIGAAELDLQGAHPALGRVTVRQLLATWAAHDLAHVVQIGRTMARRYRNEVGPWAAYLSVMK